MTILQRLIFLLFLAQYSYGQLPLSGRGGQNGSVTPAQTAVPGVTTSVNTLNTTVQVQGPYAGSASSVAKSPFTGKLSLRDAVERGLAYNLGSGGLNNAVRQARGQARVAPDVHLSEFGPDARHLTADARRSRLGRLGARRRAAGHDAGPARGRRLEFSRPGGQFLDLTEQVRDPLPHVLGFEVGRDGRPAPAVEFLLHVDDLLPQDFLFIDQRRALGLVLVQLGLEPLGGIGRGIVEIVLVSDVRRSCSASDWALAMLLGRASRSAR